MLLLEVFYFVFIDEKKGKKEFLLREREAVVESDSRCSDSDYVHHLVDTVGYTV